MAVVGWQLVSNLWNAHGSGQIIAFSKGNGTLKISGKSCGWWNIMNHLARKMKFNLMCQEKMKKTNHLFVGMIFLCQMGPSFSRQIGAGLGKCFFRRCFFHPWYVAGRSGNWNGTAAATGAAFFGFFWYYNTYIPGGARFQPSTVCHSFATTFWCVHAENVDLFSRFIFEGVVIHWAVLIVMSKWETDHHFPDPKWRANEQ